MRSRHFISSDLRNFLNGRVYLKGNAMPSNGFRNRQENGRLQQCNFPHRLRKAKKTKSSTSTKTCCCSDSFKESETLQGTNANELKKDAGWKSGVDSWRLQTSKNELMHFCLVKYKHSKHIKRLCWGKIGFKKKSPRCKAKVRLNRSYGIMSIDYAKNSLAAREIKLSKK